MVVFYLAWGGLFCLMFCILMIMSSWFLFGSCCILMEVVSSSSGLVDFFFVLDILSLSFCALVCFISSCVVVYSASYMSSSDQGIRFFVLVLLFVIFMGFLIFVPSLIGLIIGWEGIGLCSFFLIVYYQGESCLSSGMVTAISNRLGDILIMVMMSFSFSAGHWALFYGVFMGGAIWVTLLVCGMTKSAQFPFCYWLPLSMSAPTPVSSLVHSSTLVVAGIYLIIRYSGCLFADGYVSWIMMGVGLVTMVIASLGSVLEFNLKKIVALSTLSHLGFMFLACGLGLFWVALFHLFIHGLCKALLFMGTGSIISSRGSEDIRLIGGSLVDMPVSFMVILVSYFSLSGLPFFSGFYSKDMIIEGIFITGLGVFLILCLCIFISLSFVNCFRLLYYSMSFPMNGPSLFVSGDSLIFVYSTILLLFGCVFSGSVVKSFLLVSLEGSSGMLSIIFMIFCMLLGLVICVVMFNTADKNFSSMKKSSFLIFFLSQMWFVPIFSGEVIASSGFEVSDKLYSWLEGGWIEVSGFIYCSMVLMNTMNSRVQMLSFNMIVGLMMVFIGFVLFFMFMF